MYEKVPQFNAPIFLENKEQIGKVDEIFGPIKDFVSLNFTEVIFFTDGIALFFCAPIKF